MKTTASGSLALVAALLALAGCAGTHTATFAPAKAGYFCASLLADGLENACDDGSVSLQMKADGTWSWYDEQGRYKQDGDHLTFAGDADTTRGPAKWGPAHFDNDRLVFDGNGVRQVWIADTGDATARAAMAGTYRCDQTDAYGEAAPCDDDVTVLALAPDGTWTYGADTGRWTVEGGRAYFRATDAEGGPPAWGVAVVHPDGVSFHGTLNDHTTLFVKQA